MAAPVPHAASAESVMKSSGFTDHWPRLDSWGQPAVGEQDDEQAAEQQGDQPCGAHEQVVDQRAALGHARPERGAELRAPK